MQLASIQRFVEETREKLESSNRSCQGHDNAGHEYGSLVGSLPSQVIDSPSRPSSLVPWFSLGLFSIQLCID